jgi:hypothetical protein
MSLIFQSVLLLSVWPSIKTIIERPLFINAENGGCYFKTPRALEDLRDGEARAQIRPHQSKQLSKVMACHIHKLAMMSLHGRQTFTVSNKPLVPWNVF